MKKDHPVRWDYHRRGVRRWLDGRGNLVDNELTIDTLEYVYDICWASWQYKVDVQHIEECVVLGDVVYSAEQGVVISRFMIPFWSLPLSDSMPSLRDLNKAFEDFAIALAVPAKMMAEAMSSFASAYETMRPRFYGMYQPGSLEWQAAFGGGDGPSDEDLAELRWLASPWRTPEDLSWLSPDGGEYEQRYRHGNQ